MSSAVLAGASGAWLAVEAGVVVDQGERDAPSGANVIGDVVFAPGFVDVQINGIRDVDFWTAAGADWDRVGRWMLESGVTSYLPTLVSAPLDRFGPGLDRVAAAAAAASSAGLARIEGVHLEGPFLGDAPGAHPVELLRPMEVDWLVALLDAHPDLVRLVTLAPESDADLAGTRALAARGVVVSLGHSRCTYEQAVAAADAGATMVTHLFNGMGPLGHRAPGLPGAALDDDRLTPSLIADLVHVHPAVLRLAARRKDCILVTDAVAVGSDSLGGRVIERDGAAFLEDGTLTGSTLTLDQAVRTVARLVGVARAIEMATVIPARVLGLDTYGARGLGGRADLVALDRSSLDVVGVWLAGEQAYARP